MSRVEIDIRYVSDEGTVLETKKVIPLPELLLMHFPAHAVAYEARKLFRVIEVHDQYGK